MRIPEWDSQKREGKLQILEGVSSWTITGWSKPYKYTYAMQLEVLQLDVIHSNIVEGIFHLILNIV